MRPSENRRQALRLTPRRRALGIGAALLLVGCASTQHDPVQPMLALDEGRYYIRSVTLDGASDDPSFEEDFRRRLNSAETIDEPAGLPVDLVVTIGADAADVALRNAGSGHHTVFRATALTEAATADVRGVNDVLLDAFILWFFFHAPGLFFVDYDVDNPPESDVIADGGDAADIIIERLIEPGLITLAAGAAFAPTPDDRDVFDAAPLFDAAAGETTPDEPIGDALDFGVYGSLRGALDEVDRIRRASAAIDSPDLLSVTKTATGYAVTAAALEPDVARALCAYRRVEGRVCERR